MESPGEGGWLPPATPGQQQPAQPQQPYNPYGYQPYGYPPPGQQAPYWPQTVYWQQEPGNTPAMVGFIMSIASIATTFMSIGFLSPITLLVSIASTIVSRTGQKKVDRGETRKSRDLATWGFWLGIAGIVLALLALTIWIVAIASNPDLFDDTSSPDGEPA